MGIYVQCIADGVREPAPQFAALLQQSVERWAVKRHLSDLLHTVADKTGLRISFYPPAGSIRFEINQGRVSFDAKTSIAGPGFHASLIELCDFLSRDLGLKWRWDSGGDQTGYAVHRDVARLRTAFIEQFLAFCSFYNESAGTIHALNLPEGLAIDGFEGVATPYGPKSLSFFIDALTDDENITENARQIFPWWETNADSDPRFWINTMRGLLWSEVEWRAPRTSWEQHVLNATNRIGARLDLGSDIALQAAVRELNDLSSNSDTFTNPATVGIGYRRHRRTFFLTGPWRINLPAYYIEESEDDGQTVCLWFGAHAARASSWVAEPPGDPHWSSAFLDSKDIHGSGFVYRLSPATAAEDDPGAFLASALFHAHNHEGRAQILHLSLYTLDSNTEDAMKELARHVWLNPPQARPVKDFNA